MFVFCLTVERCKKIVRNSREKFDKGDRKPKNIGKPVLIQLWYQDRFFVLVHPK